MFTLEGKLTFINIDQNYLKKLYDICSEVYYKPSGYENKPYIGILINKNDRKYVIPLSSAKAKHKTWKNVDKECYLVYEMAKKSSMGQGDIWVAAEDDDVKHILSVMDIKKMIPIVDGVYSRVNINPEDVDTDDVKKCSILRAEEESKMANKKQNRKEKKVDDSALKIEVEKVTEKGIVVLATPNYYIVSINGSNVKITSKNNYKKGDIVKI